MQYTSHIRLPLFEGADKPTWLHDWNETMTKLDDIIYQMNQSDLPAEVAELVTRIEALERTVAQHDTDISALQDQVTSILSDVSFILSIIPSNASPSNKLATMADIPGGSTPGIPIASATQLGGIKVGRGFTVDPTTGVADVIGSGSGGGNFSRTVIFDGRLNGTENNQHWILDLPAELAAYGSNWRDILNAFFLTYDAISISALCFFSPNPDEHQNCQTTIRINKSQFNRSGSYPSEQVYNGYGIAMTFATFGGNNGSPRFFRMGIDTTTNYIDMSCCINAISDTLQSMNKECLDQIIIEGINYNVAPTPQPSGGGDTQHLAINSLDNGSPLTNFISDVNVPIQGEFILDN